MFSFSSTEHDQCLQFPDAARSCDHLHWTVVCSVFRTATAAQPVDWDASHHSWSGCGWHG